MPSWLRIAALVLFAVVVAVLPLFHGGFIVTLMNYVGIYTLITLGLVLLTGCGGITSFGQAAFVGLGAYATAYLSTAAGLSPWIGLLAGIVLTAFVATAAGCGLALRREVKNRPKFLGGSRDELARDVERLRQRL